MHHQLYALGVGVVVEGGYVEVGVGGHEVKHEVLLLSEPVLPTYVPTLDEELVHAVVGCKIDVSSYILVVGTVMSVGLRL